MYDDFIGRVSKASFSEDSHTVVHLIDSTPNQQISSSTEYINRCLSHSFDNSSRNPPPYWLLFYVYNW